jgi:DNA-binding CsgD family transcriptional regulator
MAEWFVDRQTELSTLDRLLLESTREGARVVQIIGAGGMGKTALLSVFSSRARASGALVLTATAVRDERDVPLGMLRQLFGSIDRTVTDDGRLGSHLDTRVVDSLSALLLEVANGRPVVLAVDDIHHADHDSMLAVMRILRRVAAHRVVAVFTEWRWLGSSQSPLLTEAIPQHYFQHVRLAPLSLPGVTKLLQPHLGDAADHRASAYRAVTGGSPLLLQALIEDYNDRIDDLGHEVLDDEPLVLGDNFAAAVAGNIQRWDPGLLEVARGIAVLGEAGTSTLLADLLEIDSVAAEKSVTALNATGVLTLGRFNHPVARNAVLDDFDMAARSSMYSCAARLLYYAGAAPTEIAAGLVAAGRATEEWTVSVLRDAAKQAMADADPIRAANFLELAVRACHTDSERVSMVSMLARVRWLVNPSAVTPLLSMLCDAADRGLLDERDTLALCSFLGWHGQSEEAAATLARLDGGRPNHEFDLRGAIHLSFTRLWLRFVSPSDDLPRHGDQDGQGEAILAEENLGALTSVAVQLLQSCSVVDTPLDAVLAALFVLIRGNNVDAARRWCQILSQEAEVRHATTWTAALAAVRSFEAMLSGEMSGAEQYAKQSLDVMPPHGWGVVVDLPVSCLVLATIAQGKTTEAEALVRQQVPEGVSQNLFWLNFLRARGHLYQATGRLHAALVDFQMCGQFLARWSLDVPSLLPWRTDMAEVQLTLGRPLEARKLLEEQFVLPGGMDLPVRGRSLRLLAATEEPPERVVLLTEAVSLLERSGDARELGLAVDALSLSRHALGQSTESLPTDEPADQPPPPGPPEQRHGDPADTDLLEELSSNLEVLSTAERNVAALAALGQTNREIGRTLFITVSTVEQHLTRVYRKLNITRRSDLPTELQLSVIECH